MKSKLLFTFAVVAAFAAVILSGCSTTTTTTSNCIDYTGTDTGQHNILINGIPNLVPPIRDTLNITNGIGGAVDIYSHALGTTLFGTKDASDCNKVLLDSLIYLPTDTLRIHSENALFASIGGNIKIFGIRAGGVGSVSTSGVTTQLKIKTGKTNVDALGGLLLDLSGKNLVLNGVFLKIP